MELPLSEGRYFWAWQIDGKVHEPGSPGSEPGDYGLRVVRPVQAIGPPR